jgi:hypothetical protein
MEIVGDDFPVFHADARFFTDCSPFAGQLSQYGDATIKPVAYKPPRTAAEPFKASSNISDGFGGLISSDIHRCLHQPIQNEQDSLHSAHCTSSDRNYHFG